MKKIQIILLRKTAFHANSIIAIQNVTKLSPLALEVVQALSVPKVLLVIHAPMILADASGLLGQPDLEAVQALRVVLGLKGRLGLWVPEAA